MIKIGNKVFLRNKTYIMGVLNVTPDSFSDGGKFFSPEKAVEHALFMAEQGASIIDVGGESTRPFSDPVPLEEELKRVIPVISELRKRSNVLISVDTYKSEVAEEAIKAGAQIVNDISGFRFDPKMPEVVAKHGASVVLMHILGTPKDMQTNPTYRDVVGEIIAYLKESADIALKNGIPSDKIIVDPGIGFGKTVEHNLIILKRIEEFMKELPFPLLVGTSRKSFIGKVLNISEPELRIYGTVATTAYLAYMGVNFVRVHDVKENLDAIKMVEAIKQV